MLARPGSLLKRGFSLLALLLLVAGFGIAVAQVGARYDMKAAGIGGPLNVADVPRQAGPYVPPVFGPNVRSNSDTTVFGQHEPSLAVSRTNPNFVVVAQKDYREGNVKHVWIDVSTDGGVTWPANKQLKMPGVPASFTIQSDPVVMARDDGRIYVSCLATNDPQSIGGVFITWSDDGTTWQTPSVPVYGNESTLDDKDWFAIDNNPSSPYYHRMYMMYAPGANYVTEQHSTDGGLTWSTRQSISPTNTEYTYPVVASDGTVYNFMMFNWGQGQTGTVQMTKSTNGGATWSTPQNITQAQQPPNNIRPGDSFRFFSILSAGVDPSDLDPSTRDLYVAWTDNRNFSTNGVDVVYVKSSNGGASWGPVTRLSHDPTGVVRDHITPMITVGADSKVHAFWLDRRLDPNNRFFDSWYSSSTDGGATWDPDTRVSSQSQDLNIAFPPGSGNAAGDYWGLDVVGNTVYVAWNDTRSGDQDILVSRGVLSGGSTPTPTPLVPTSTSTSTFTATNTSVPPSPTGSTATNTNVLPSSTSVASATRTLTATPLVTSTSGAFCPVTPTGSSTSCSAPSTYNYSFQFSAACGINGTATLKFQVSASSSGPWTDFDTQTFSVSFHTGANTVQGALSESGIPAQYSYYRITISMLMQDGLTTNSATDPTLLCSTGGSTATVTASATRTVTGPTSTSTSTGTIVVPSSTVTVETTGTVTATTSPTSTPICPAVWHTVPAPASTDFISVSALSPNDVWVVGSNGNLYHWGGNQWTDTSYPVPEGMGGSLVAVSAWSTNDVWAAGSYSDIGGNSFPLIEHWDGSAWAIVGMDVQGKPVPSGGTLSNVRDITAVGPEEAWAVGGSSTSLTAITRYCNLTNGCLAHTQDSFASELLGVSGISAGDVWAVGYTHGFPLITHWDGTTWSNNISSPIVATLNDVEMISHDDAWAASEAGLIHWNGSAWNTVGLGVGAKSISGIASNDMWAAGTLLQHWNGTSWEVDPYTPASQLRSISADDSDDVWAVGDNSLILHYTDQHYVDVPPDNTFFTHINYLTCLGIMSGYVCGGPGEPCDLDNTPYFRPNASITRGQLSKIIANAAGFNDGPGTQIYEDVPESNVFYAFVQRLTNHGVMSGYQCGLLPEEPCVEPGNRPYFRPFANATRGQISKIVANAADVQDPIPTDQQTYTDVPPNSTFWVYIERLTGRGVMSGYLCGSEGEPCDSENRPYFRPGNNATRGQTSKIVANTFFPTCCSRR